MAGIRDWDPMREDYNDTDYDAQYPDNDLQSSVTQLDHNRLYIRNLPQSLNTQGLRSLFNKFGTLLEAYVHSDPGKRFGLVRFETAGEASLAMMKLNKAEPFRLNISIAHKSKATKNNTKNMGTPNHAIEDSRNISYMTEDTYSQESLRNTIRINSTVESDEELDYPYFEDEMISDTVYNIEMEKKKKIRLMQIKLKQEELAVEQRLLLMSNTSSPTPNISRRFLSDGRIVIRNCKERNPDLMFDKIQDKASEFDASGPPPPKRLLCDTCGDDARFACSRCSGANYCSRACQTQDWAERHRAVCQPKHSEEIDNISKINQVAPLRRPRSPAPSNNDDFSRDGRVTNKTRLNRDIPKENNDRPFRGTLSNNNAENNINNANITQEKKQ